MKILSKYFELQKEIFDYFGYKEDWVVIPLDDRRDVWWKLGKSMWGDGIGYAKTKKELVEKSGNYYEDEIYTQCFLPKYVYRGKKYTMVCVDTHTDGNKFLAIYDNKKKVD
jgi:hypothetical protein